MNYRDAVIQVLKDEKRELHYEEISALAIERKYIEPKGKTPQDTISTEISRDLRKFGSESVFLRYGKGIYGLREFEVAVNVSPKDEISEHYEHSGEYHQDRVL